MKIKKIVLLLLLLISPLTVSAFSTSYSNVETDVWLNRSIFDFTFSFNSNITSIHEPNYSVTYSADVINTGTGENLSSGDFVPIGTQIEFRPRAHNSTDAYMWSDYIPTSILSPYTGTVSPRNFFSKSVYSSWVNNGELPSGRACVDKNLLYSETNTNYFCFLCDFVLGGVTYIRNIESHHYTPFSINPPTVTGQHNGTATLSCDSSGLLCTLTNGGTIDSNIVFAQTYAYVYGAQTAQNLSDPIVPLDSRTCDAWKYPLSWPRSWSSYKLNIPQQIINITLNGGDSNNAPVTPTIIGPISGYPDINYTFSFTSSDPDGDTIRYGIDWNNDGTVNQWVPGSGYISSGTQQSWSKTWTTNGEKTIKVLAQDSVGLNSGWGSHTISITISTTQCSDGIDNNGNGYIDYPDDPACSSALDNNEEVLAPASISLVVSPRLVAVDSTTSVIWTAESVEEDSCTITGTNGDSWNLSGSGGSETTSVISQRSIFTLRCTDLEGDILSESVTVITAPKWKEI